MTADPLAARFETARPQLGAIAYRMLGSVDDAQDAVQEAWLRLSGADSAGGRPIVNLDAWLTTVVARICLNTLRDRHARGLGKNRWPSCRIRLSTRTANTTPSTGQCWPTRWVWRCSSCWTLPPAERLAFVLHDVFTVPFDQIAPIVDRTPEATRKLASRARHRIQQADPVPDADLAVQRAAVDAFFAAGRTGDFDRLVSVLDPNVVLRGDFGTGLVRAEGAPSVAKLARGYAGPEREVRAAVVNGVAGAVIVVAGQPVAIMAFVVRNGLIGSDPRTG